MAKDLLKAHLSPELVKRIDWDSLETTNRSYIDEKFKQLHSDVVYRCLLDGNEAYLYTLIEQQTNPCELLPFRVRKYEMALLQSCLDQGNKQLPVVVSLVIYSGKKSPYPYSLDIYDCFQDPSLARKLMFKPLDLIDLGQLSEDELAQHGSAALLALLLKQSQKQTFLNWIKDHPELMLKLLASSYGISGLVYILGVESEHDADELMQAITSIAPTKRKKL